MTAVGAGRRRLFAAAWVAAASLAAGWFVSGCGDSGSAPPPAPVPPPTAPEPTPPPPEPTPTPEPACSGLVVEAAHEGVRREEYESFGGSFSIRDESAETAIHIVAPYRDGGRYPPPSWAFVEDFSFRETAAGFERTVGIEWIGELELSIEAPNCDPYRVVCDAEQCLLNPEEEEPPPGAAAP